MIVGHIDNLDDGAYAYPPAIKKALAWLQAQDFTQMEIGRYDIAGDDIYASLQTYETRNVAKCRPEAHRKYIDIQYMVKGAEYLGWCVLTPAIEVTEAYNEATDVEFYKELLPQSNIVLADKTFAVLYPQDVHRPCCRIYESAPVLKVVVKIAVSCLGK